MKIIVDDKIPYLREVLPKHFSEVFFTDNITAQHTQNADALIIRTRTTCNKDLLQNSMVKAIATATIGTDHIDLDYCSTKNVNVYNSKGCNAKAVSQWVFSALNSLDEKSGTIGIIGVGNVGSIVAQIAQNRGFKTLLCDPPKQKMQHDKTEYVELDYLLRNADIITLHVPLNSETKLMANDYFFDRVKTGTTFLNASRGEVVDENSLLRAINTNTITNSAIDVWTNEPNINLELLKSVNIATPHIAGYSAKGKAVGSQMAVQAIAKQFGITQLSDWTVEGDFNDESPELYDIMIDDDRLRNSPESFESQRSKYNLR